MFNVCMNKDIIYTRSGSCPLNKLWGNAPFLVRQSANCLTPGAHMTDTFSESTISFMALMSKDRRFCSTRWVEFIAWR